MFSQQRRHSTEIISPRHNDKNNKKGKRSRGVETEGGGVTSEGGGVTSEGGGERDLEGRHPPPPLWKALSAQVDCRSHVKR